MMQSLLIAISSAAVGAAVALFFARPELPPARTTARVQPLDLSGLEAAFRRALRDVEVTAVLPPVPAEDKSTGAAPSPGPIRGSGPADHRATGRALPPAGVDVLSGLRSFVDDSGLRRSWLLRGEADVLEWLGTPDRIEAGNGAESWWYELEGRARIHLTFHRGRLIKLYRHE